MLAETSFLIDLLKAKKEAIEFLEKNTTPLLYTTEICVFELIVGAYALRDKPEQEVQKIN
ncbi:type II toxin-antitoxin system VapC family toxin, partial [Candidatus Woesearchaeota archaeon]|nr:type II toxin-antitoxin system VapC family toxin [Candidatus Woesearchaeota archaeon]